MEKKKIYLAPDLEMMSVELESSICSGSVDITNPEGKQNGEIEDQKVNTDFDFTPTDEWKEVK